MSVFRGVAIALLLFGVTGTPRFASAATYHVDQRLPAADDRNDGSEANPWKTISRAAAAVRPGDTVMIATGTYRESVTLVRGGTPDAPIRFEAAPAANVVITGANRINRWTKEPGDANVFSTSWGYDFIPWNPTHSHPNDDYHLLIGRCEQVFIGGQPLRQVLECQHLARGTFFVDLIAKRLTAWSADNRNLADDDTICEASARSVLWECKGDYIETSGLRFRYAANPAQRGAAIFAGNHDTVEDCIFERTSSVGAAFLGQDLVVRHCAFQDNGQLGFSADRAHRLRMSDCVICRNNTKGFSREWEAGGDKLVLCRGVVIEQSIFKENHGVGIWFDMGNEDCAVHNCLIADNEDAGLFDEISYGLHVHDNVIIGNGFAETRGAWGASCGVSLSSSPGSRIERNLIIGNKEGFNFREAIRATPRIDAAPDAAPQPIWNHDEVITHNVLAYNRDAQVWGWFDVDDERHWPAAMQEHKAANGESRLSLESLKFEFSGNLCAMGAGQHLLHWGTPWKRNRTYSLPEDVRRELGFENGSAIVKFPVRDFAALDFRISRDCDAMTRGCYPRGEVPGVQLGDLTRQQNNE